MRRLLILATALFALVALAPLAAAGNGLKFETIGLNEYAAAGVDVELGLPGVPLRPFVEVVGWWASNDEQVTHVQAGAGARFYLFAPSSGLFAEARARYVVPIENTGEASVVFLAGGGYRLKALIGLDVYASATLSEHDILPKYLAGVRIGF